MTDTHAEPSELGTISISGPDAAEFLRAQFTTDITHLTQASFGLTAWCDAQGNTLALFYVAPVDDGYYAITSSSLIDGLIKRLRMYVLRAQVDITDLRGSHRILAQTNTDMPNAGERRDNPGRIELGLATAEQQPLALTLCANDAECTSEIGIATNTNTFQLARVDAGIPTVDATTRAKFVPQMLNLHWLQAVDFDKGCFPGQEVVARLQNRGKLTQRVYCYDWQGKQPAIGDDILDNDGRSRGTVVRTARISEDADNDGRLLAVVKTNAADTPDLTTHSANLTLGELPYPTPGNARPD